MTEPTAQPEDLTGAWQPEPQVPWCCTGRGYVSECPLCPEYGASLLEPCPGHEASEENQTRVVEARLHAERRHPGYEYATTRGPRKQWDDADRPPAGENADPDYTWEPNLDAGHPGAGWERFDYHEEAYWRRRKTPPQPADAPRSAPQPADGPAERQDGHGAAQAAQGGSGLPDVQGRCPACGTSGLFLGDGGYITCSLIDCPQPDAATEVIADFWKARQHGTFTFCEQNVGHVTMTEFAKKITEKVTAVGQRKEAVAYANEQKQRAEQAEAAIARIYELHRKANNGDTCVYCAHGQRLGYDTTWPCDTIRALAEPKEN